MVHKGFPLGVPKEGIYKEVLNSDAERFGGSNVINEGTMESKAAPCNRCQFSINLDVPPLGVVILEREIPAKAPKASKAQTKAKTPVKKEGSEKNTEKTEEKADLA